MADRILVAGATDKVVEARVGARVVRFETVVSSHQGGTSVVVSSGGAAVMVTTCPPVPVRAETEVTAATGSSRLIDRATRSLCPDGRHDTHVIVTQLSTGPDHDTEVLSLCGAGAVLALSMVPGHRAMAAVRIARVARAFVLNPTADERRRSSLNLIAAGTADGIVMVEASAAQVDEAIIVDALALAQAAIQHITRAISTLATHTSAATRVMAERALSPSHETFPYTMRMVPTIPRPHDSTTAGVTTADRDMDFTVVGTARGITELQMDITVAGMTSTRFAVALAQARIARLKILDAMQDATSLEPAP